MPAYLSTKRDCMIQTNISKTKAVNLYEGCQVRLLGIWCVLLSKIWVDDKRLKLVVMSFDTYITETMIVEYDAEFETFEIV